MVPWRSLVCGQLGGSESTAVRTPECSGLPPSLWQHRLTVFIQTL